VLGAHTCNLSYLGGKDQKDLHSKLALAKSWTDLISKIPNIKKHGWWSDSSRVPAASMRS
jgi:hypothetical protein